jgi:hypothetical protein
VLGIICFTKPGLIGLTCTFACILYKNWNTLQQKCKNNSKSTYVYIACHRQGMWPVTIQTRSLGLDDWVPRVRFPAGAGNFSLHHRVQNGSGAHPASYPVGTGRVLSLGIKRPRSEDDPSPPSSAKAKNAWSYTSTPQYVFTAWCVVKHRDSFTYTFTFTCPLDREDAPRQKKKSIILTTTKIWSWFPEGFNAKTNWLTDRPTDRQTGRQV